MQESREIGNLPWIILFISIFIIVLSFLIFYGLFKDMDVKSYDLSEDSLLTGVELTLQEKMEINFYYAQRQNTFYVSSLEGDFLQGVLNGDLKELYPGESKFFDLNGDQIYDVKFTPYDFEGSLYLFIIGLVEEECVENWQCSKWSPCLDGFMNRVCVDSNSCGTELTKPEVESSC